MAESTSIYDKIQFHKEQLRLLKEQYLKIKIYNLLKLTEDSISNWGIHDIKFKINDDTWIIHYIHKTLLYDENNYINDEDSSVETIMHEKETSIKFGVKFTNDKLKHFIIGNPSQKFKIYRNSSGILSILNEHYEYELSIKKQISLIKKYSNNPNIPEWLALKMFLHIRKEEISNNDILLYLMV